MSDTEEDGQAATPAVQAQFVLPPSNLPPLKALTFDDNLALSWRHGNKLGNGMNEGENQDDISLVLQKFDQFCAPRTQIIYERYRFNNRNQEPSENVSTYLAELRAIARNCAHDTITPDEILHDRLVLGIHVCDDRVHGRLLRLNDLSLQQAVDIIKSSEQTQQQVKQMSGGDTLVHTLKKFGPAVQVEDEKSIKPSTRRATKECGN